MKRVRSLLTISVVAVCVISLASPVTAQEGETGRIDWVSGYITGFGFGSAQPGTNKAVARVSSVRAAKVDGLRNLLEMIKGVQIDSETIVEDLMTKKDTISARVEGMIKGAEMVSQNTEWMEGSPVTTVEMRVCISASAQGCSPGRSLVSALDLTKLEAVERVPDQAYVAPKAPPPPTQPEATDYHYDSSKPVTGVVFSLGGYYYKRVVLPVIGTKSGDDVVTVYSVRQVKPRIVRTYGIARFVDTLDQVEAVDKIGSNYLVVPVEDVTDENMILISGTSAQKIHETTRHGNNYLEKAAVVLSTE